MQLMLGSDAIVRLKRKMGLFDCPSFSMPKTMSKEEVIDARPKCYGSPECITVLFQRVNSSGGQIEEARIAIGDKFIKKFWGQNI
jgi:hypothetical protein